VIVLSRRLLVLLLVLGLLLAGLPVARAVVPQDPVPSEAEVPLPVGVQSPTVAPEVVPPVEAEPAKQVGEQQEAPPTRRTA
jgi:hypothetical protein